MDVYFDESGNCSKMYDGRDSTRYFTLTAVATSDSSRTANIVVDLIKSYNISDELKYGQASSKVKRKFAEKFQEVAEDEFLKAYSVSVDRKNIPERYRYDSLDVENILYSLVTCNIIALTEDLKNQHAVDLHFDKKYDKGKRRDMLNSLSADFFQSIHSVEPNEIKHVDSRNEKNIQVADMIAGLARSNQEGYRNELYEKYIEPYSKHQANDMSFIKMILEEWDKQK